MDRRERITQAVAGTSPVGLSAGRCIRLRGRVDCDLCEMACHASLGPWDSPGESEAWESCSSCGACVAVCPTDALRLSDQQWRRTLRDLSVESAGVSSTSGRLRVACSAMSDGSEDVSVSCLASIDLVLVAHAWSEGTRVLEVVRSACGDCPMSDSSDRSERLVNDANDLAADLACDRRAVLVPGPARPADVSSGEHMDRRGFMRWLTARGSSALGAVAADVIPDVGGGLAGGEDGAGVPGLRRRVAVAAMRALTGTTSREMNARRGPTATAVPVIDPLKCTLCGDCAVFCPVGALAMWDDEGERLLGITPADCVACGVCETLCRFGAISMREPNLQTLFEDPEVVVGRPVATCVRCKQTFAGGEGATLCPTCSLGSERFKRFY